MKLQKRRRCNLRPTTFRYKLRRTREKVILEGSWVDGGLVNNNPIHAFDVDEDKKRTTLHEEGFLNPNLLGIRLGSQLMETTHLPGGNMDINVKTSPENVLKYFKTVIETIIDNSSQLQINSKLEKDRVLDLTTSLGKNRELTVTDFQPDEKLLKDVLRLCYKETMQYFGLSPDGGPLYNTAQQAGFSQDLKKIIALIRKD